MTKDVSDNHQECLTPPENAAIIPPLCDAEVQGNAEGREIKTARLVVGSQVVVTLIAAVLVYVAKGSQQTALAVLCGGGISVVNGSLLAWRMSQVAMNSVKNVHHQLRLMYLFAAERFLVVIVLLALCMLVLKLMPLALLGGFVMGQAVLLLSRMFLSRFKTEIVIKNVE